MALIKKILRCVMIIFGLLLVLLVSAVMIGPRLLNEAAVKARITELIKEKSAGAVTVDDAEMAWFPLPQVIVHKIALKVPGKLSGNIETVRIYPKLLPLLSGNIRLSRLRAERPSLTIYLPEHKEEETETLQHLAAMIRAAFLGSPSVALQIDDAEVSLKKGNQPPVVLKDVDIQLAADNRDDRSGIILKRMNCALPRLSVSGSFFVQPSAPLVRLEMKGTGIDVPGVRHAALSLFREVPTVQKIFEILKSGTAEQITFESRGASLDDLGKTNSIKISGRLRKGSITIPSLGFDFSDVNGDCDVAEGILKGRSLSGMIMQSKVRSGGLSLGLKGRDALLHLDADVSADMKDVHLILRRLIKSPDFSRELEHLKSVAGRAEGRIRIGESISDTKIRVDVSSMRFSADYDRVPPSIEVGRGLFRYDENSIVIKGLQARVGKSDISDLSAELRIDDGYHLDIQSGRGDIDTAEVHSWLKSYERLKKPLEKLTSISGILKLSSINWKGRLKEISGPAYSVTGSAERLLVATPLLPDTAYIKSRRFVVAPKEVTISDSVAEMPDSSFFVSGKIGISGGDISRADLDISGSAGPKGLHWIKKEFEIPEYVRTDQKLIFRQAHLDWALNDHTSFLGEIKTEKGQSVSIDLLKNSRGLVIRRLDVRDGLSHASINMEFLDSVNRLGFSGRLNTSTASEFVSINQIQGGAAEGEFRAELRRGKPDGPMARGRLNLEKVTLPYKQGMPLYIDSAKLVADRGRLNLDSVHIHAGDNDFSVRGTAEERGGAVGLDLDISSDRLVWDAFSRMLEKETGPEGRKDEVKTGKVKVEGNIRFNVGSFVYDSLTLQSVKADMDLEKDGINVLVRAGQYCNMNLTGTITKNNRDLSVDIRPSAKGLELGPTIGCITAKNADISGRFDLDGQILLRGSGSIDRRSLAGHVDFRAKDGRIYRFTTLAKIFSLLNVTEIFRGRFPDFLQKGFGYDSFTVKGEIKAGKLGLREARIDAPSMELIGDGNIDLVDATGDMKILVAPFRTVDSVIRVIPWWKESSIVSIPVKVTGKLKDPDVSYLSLPKIGPGLTGLMEKVLKAPVKILEPLIPEKKE